MHSTSRRLKRAPGFAAGASDRAASAARWCSWSAMRPYAPCHSPRPVGSDHARRECRARATSTDGARLRPGTKMPATMDSPRAARALHWYWCKTVTMASLAYRTSNAHTRRARPPGQRQSFVWPPTLGFVRALALRPGDFGSRCVRPERIARAGCVREASMRQVGETTTGPGWNR